MRRILCFTLSFCLAICLCGCGSLFSETYVSIKPHQDDTQGNISGQLIASSYPEIYQALASLIRGGEERGIVFLSDLSEQVCTSYMEVAIKNVISQDPVGAYAVDSIIFDLGSNAGRLAAAVEIVYSRSKTDLAQIKTVRTVDEAQVAIGHALEQASGNVVVRIKEYEQIDFSAIVRSYADANPAMVMETPQVMTAVYPRSGQERLVELTFTYQNTQEELMRMQEMVRPVFTAAELYVQGDSTQRNKFFQLYSFLMERFEYKIRSSATPAYSLLHEGIGDSRAFACVYAAMCRQAGLECRVVTGTRDGAAWSWNRVVINNRVYYIDLINAERTGRFQLRTSSEMSGYAWNRNG